MSISTSTTPPPAKIIGISGKDGPTDKGHRLIFGEIIAIIKFAMASKLPDLMVAEGSLDVEPWG
jgi:hypothetical protein